MTAQDEHEGDAAQAACETDPSKVGGNADEAQKEKDKAENEQKPDPIAKLANDLALAEAMKPLEAPTIDVHSKEPDRLAALKKLADAYTAAAAADGPLTLKFAKAQTSFDRAAIDMDKDGRLDEWLDYEFAAEGPLKTLLDERKRLAADLAPPSGPNDQARNTAQAKAKRAAGRYADWSAPVDKITAIIGQYADKIDNLNKDINTEVNRYAAITTFWFEIAPKHLQLARELAKPVQAVVDKVAAKLAGYEDMKALLALGPARGGDIYLVADAAKAEAQRVAALDAWIIAATELAGANAAFKLDPDDPATRQQRFDKLKDDGWIAEAKKLPEPPKS